MESNSSQDNQTESPTQTPGKKLSSSVQLGTDDLDLQDSEPKYDYFGDHKNLETEEEEEKKSYYTSSDKNYSAQGEDYEDGEGDLYPINYDPNTMDENDPNYAKHLQELYDEIEQIEAEIIRRTSNREELLSNHAEITEKLNNIGTQNSEVVDDESIGIMGELAILKIEESMWEKKIKKIDNGLKDVESGYKQKHSNKREIILNSVEDALSKRFNKHTEDKYSKQIAELNRKIKAREEEIEAKYIAFQREKEECEALEREYGLKRGDGDRIQAANTQDAERLQNVANAQELANAKPAGVMSYVSN